MAKTLWMAFALLISVGLWSAPAMAQTNESDDNLDSIQRSGAEGSADTTLGSKGLVFTTDGFSLRMTTRVQFRMTYQNEVGGGRGQDASATNGRDFINFRVRRAKTGFEGYIFQKEFQYKLLLSWVSSANIVEEAWFRWAAFEQYVNITAGQTKLNWNWEETSSSGKMQFVDRSYVNEVFNHGWAKGLTIDGQIGADTPWLKYWFGIYNGVLAGADDFRNNDVSINADTFSQTVDNEMMINLRLETHPMGEVAYGMYDGRGEDERDQILFAVGLGVNWFMSGYENGAVRGDTVGTPTTSGRSRTSQDTWSITLDGHFRWMGLSVDAAFFWRHTEFHNRGANRFDPTSQADVGNLNDSGFTFEVAYMIIPDMFNVGLRYNMLWAEDFWQGGAGAGSPRAFGIRPDASEIGLSANWFIHGDNLKLTFDFLWVGQQVPFSGNGVGLLGVYNTPPDRLLGSGTLGSSEADHNDLWIVRLQLQWIF